MSARNSLKHHWNLHDIFGIDLFYSFCRHYDLNAVVYPGSLGGAGDSVQDVFPIQIRLFVLWETNSLVVKISQKVRFAKYSSILVLTATLTCNSSLVSAFSVMVGEWLYLFPKLDKPCFFRISLYQLLFINIIFIGIQTWSAFRSSVIQFLHDSSAMKWHVAL